MTTGNLWPPKQKCLGLAGQERGFGKKVEIICSITASTIEIVKRARIQCVMIEVTRLSGEPFVVNADHIEAIEAMPDTGVLLLNGRRYVIKETIPIVLEKISTWKRRCNTTPLTGTELERRREMADRAMKEG
jgi:flagellar protein FlbD